MGTRPPRNRSNFMSSAHSKNGFTLIEVMLGVMIMALLTLAIYRFIDTDLSGIAMSQEITAKEASVRSLLAVVKDELQNLPQGQQGSLIGQPHIFSGNSSDEMTWYSAPGRSNGLFTNYSTGDYYVKLTLKPNTATKQDDLGVWRSTPNDPTPQNWLTLIPNVTSLEVRYYDPNLNAWVDTWSDQNNRPTMVRLRILRSGDASPYEAVVAMPMRGQIVLNLSNSDGTNGQNGPNGENRNPRDPGRNRGPRTPENPNGPGGPRMPQAPSNQ